MNSLFNAKIYTKTKNNINLKNNSLLDFNLKGLNLYNKSLTLFISKYNFINLILNIKNNSLSNNDLIKIKHQHDPIAKGESVARSTGPSVLLQPSSIIPSQRDVGNHEGTKNNLNINITQDNNFNKLNLIKYLEGIIIYNKNYINNNSINYVKYIDYKHINTNYLSIISKNLYDLLFNSFLSMNSLISKPFFEITNDKVIIHLFFYLFLNKNKKLNINNSFTKLNKLKLDALCQILSHIFKKPVQLELVRLYYPYFDSNIFVNLLSKIINKIQLRVIMKQFFKKAIIKNLSNNNLIILIPSLLSGIKIRIGGRLLTQRIIPRKTIKFIRKGTLAKGKINFLDEARYTNKNKRGAYTLVVSIGHYFTSQK
jgi:hypothetical protein